MHQKGIALIGMPGSGKSTIGKRLAKTLNREYIDLDALIENETGKHHSEVLLQKGADAFLQLEEEIVLGLTLYEKVFAPSGSIIYSESAMMKIQDESKIFYLKVGKELLSKRLENLIQNRGIVGLEEHGFDKLYEIRSRLYEKYADVIIDTGRLTKGQAEQAILEKL